MATAVDHAPAIDLSGALGELLAREGMSRRELARTLCVHNSVVDLWVTGKRRVPGHRVPAIATTFSMDESELLRAAAGQDLDCFWLALEGNVPPAPTPEQRLEEACLVPREHTNLVWETYCFICGRGTGPGGVLKPTREAPHVVGHCRFCQGVMFVREIGYSPIAQLMYQKPLTYSDERRVA